MSATMNIPRWPITVTADAPLHHGAFGADTGNAVGLRRIPLATLPNRRTIPAISGNALRGCLRRIIMRDLFALCDLSRLTMAAKQWDRLYAALANGGHLTGSEVRVTPDERRALREAVPALSVFGASLYTFMLPGKLSVGWLYPIARETVEAGLVPAAAELREVDDLVAEIALVRHIDREHQDPTVTGVTPMPVTVEALIPGTVMHGVVIPLVRLTDVEQSCLAWGLDQIAALGGKTGSGFGRVRVAHELDAAPYAAWREDAQTVGNAKAMLISLDARWGA